jgi:hypothetical protein
VSGIAGVRSPFIISPGGHDERTQGHRQPPPAKPASDPPGDEEDRDGGDGRSPGGGPPTGMVTFELTKKARRKLKVKTIGTISVNGGPATLTLKRKKVLRKAITIVYSGNEDFLASQLIPPKLPKKQLKSLAIGSSEARRPPVDADVVEESDVSRHRN